MPPRVAGLDAYRGLVLALMMGEALHFCGVANALPASAIWAFLCHHQDHVQWVGCSLHDLIQPGFSFLVGAALPFSLAARAGRGQARGAMIAHAFRRALILVLLGIFLRSLGHPQTRFTFEDTLTQIGLGYAFLFLLALRPRRDQWIALAVILVAFWRVRALGRARPHAVGLDPQRRARLGTTDPARGRALRPPHRAHRTLGHAAGRGETVHLPGGRQEQCRGRTGRLPVRRDHRRAGALQPHQPARPGRQDRAARTRGAGAPVPDGGCGQRRRRAHRRRPSRRAGRGRPGQQQCASAAAHARAAHLAGHRREHDRPARALCHLAAGARAGERQHRGAGSEMVPNVPRIYERAGKIVALLAKGIRALLKSHNIALVEGKGSLVDRSTVSVVQRDGQASRFEADAVILATGSNPSRPALFPFDGKKVLTSDDALRLTTLPKSMIIVGAGVIGCEWACIFRELGVEVTMVEMMPRALATEVAPELFNGGER